MAFNTIEYLKEGKVDFVFDLTLYDEEHLIEYVRNDHDRINIINGFLDKLKDTRISFCLNIIYDIEEFKEEALILLEKRGYIFLTSYRLKNVLNNTSWGKLFVINNLDELISYDYKSIDIILEYTFKDFNNNKGLINVLYLHKNLHIRYLFMKYLVAKYPELINEVYDDITKYLTSYTHQEFEQLTFIPDLMDSEDISKLAIALLKSNDIELWKKLKEHILNNYKTNYLATYLMDYSKSKEKGKVFESEFLSDIDRFFQTSIDGRLTIYKDYQKFLSNDLVSDFYEIIKVFEKNGTIFKSWSLNAVYFHGLGTILENLVSKYLELSEDKTYEYLASGSMSTCYRIGDYVFKLCKCKWSYEDVICPNLYFIHKNLEEYFVRNANGIVLAGIEIQKYLKKDAKDVEPKYFDKIYEEFDRLGYYLTDTLMNGKCGDNCRVLDSYKDADHSNPELLPDWFKEVPLVLVDRDRIYERGKLYIKQIREGY